MENKINALNAELELVKEANRVKYAALMEKVNNIINNVILSGVARLERSWADTDFKNEVFFRFEIGFHNHEKNAIDWGSEIDFTYESRTGMLSINHGCIGTFNRTNEYQFHRAAMLKYVFENIDIIENEFAQLVPEAREALDRHEEWRIESEINKINSDMRKAELERIENSIQKDVKFEYNEDACDLPHRYKLFKGVAKVTRCTPKYVFLVDEHEFLMKFKKEELINHIYKGYIDYVK